MPGVREIAKAAGVSIATVSRALRNDPSVRPQTIRLVQRKASELGYSCNPYVGKLMSSMRLGKGGTFRGNLGFIWVDQPKRSASDKRLLEIRAGALHQAETLGFTLDEFFLDEQSPQALRKILQHRGIRGILIAAPSFSSAKAYLRLDLKDFASVSLGWGLLHPALHNIRFDYYHGVHLALHHARHAFRNGIAAVWDCKTDRRANHVARAAFLAHHPAGPEAAQELFWDLKKMQPAQTLQRMKKRGIRCVLVEPGASLPAWFSHAIESCHLIQFKKPAGVSCFGWVDTQNRLMGRWGVDLLSASLHINEYGIPAQRRTVLVPPRWVAGN